MPESLPKAQRHSQASSLGPFKIWGDPTKLSVYFPDASLDELTAPAPINASVGGHTVRRYPGDPNPFTRGGHDRTTYPGVKKPNGTTPGERFWCEIRVSDGLGGFKTQASQFTYQGTFSQLKAAAIATNTIPYVLRNRSGAAYEIPFTAGP